MAAMAVCVPIVAYFGNLVYTVIESDIYKLVAKLRVTQATTAHHMIIGA